MEVSGQLHALATLPLGKEPLVFIGKEAGWTPELVWMLWRRGKSLSPARNRTSTIQPVASHYID
jgi:hypothetical protein